MQKITFILLTAVLCLSLSGYARAQQSQALPPAWQDARTQPLDLTDSQDLNKLEFARWQQRRSSKETTPADDGLTLLGEWRWGICRGVAVIDSVHIAVGNGQLLQVLDISDANQPEIVAEVATAGTVADIAVSGDYAYVIGGGHLDVVYLADVLNPQVVASWSDGVFYVLIASDIRGLPYVYLGGDNFSVIDVSDPSIPIPLIRRPRFVTNFRQSAK
ncbi:MAG: hypothetical protein ACE5IR_03355 [bacterium]